jgi:hypothetical protein
MVDDLDLMDGAVVVTARSWKPDERVRQA